MKIGFIGLGNVGSKLSNTLLRNGYDVNVLDLNKELVKQAEEKGANKTICADSPQMLMAAVDVVITCLPNPEASALVVEGEEGILCANVAGKLWLEMSSTDEAEVKRLGKKMQDLGGMMLDTPVSGGCHRADTGNIAIFAGGDREAFEFALPLLTTMGRRVLHTGKLGSASILKVLTNYLATTNLVALAEALTTAKKANMDMNITYEAIKISSGTSFVHETESQVILNGSRDINFTMDLVLKDISLFDQIAQNNGVPLRVSPLIIDIFKRGIETYGERELSPNIIKLYEEACGVSVLGKGFPPFMVDDEPEEKGAEVKP
jgi:3-hydroxyisobutyrate dehydrogenase